MFVWCLAAIFAAAAILAYVRLRLAAHSLRGDYTAWEFTQRWAPVAAVIFVLVALAMIPFRPEVPWSRIKTCMQAEQGLAQALLIYMDQHDEVLPPASTWATSAEPQNPKANTGCPDATSAYSYAFNSKLSAEPGTQIAHPKTLVLLLESDAESENAIGGPNSYPIRPRHGGIYNFAFADGHVRSMPWQAAGWLDWSP